MLIQYRIGKPETIRTYNFDLCQKIEILPRRRIWVIELTYSENECHSIRFKSYDVAKEQYDALIEAYLNKASFYEIKGVLEVSRVELDTSTGPSQKDE